jgi:uncharacterized iron-regulated membrane protein
MSPARLQQWSWIHKWSSLVCTLFLLLMCLTGLPLIFSEEINHALATDTVTTGSTGTADVQKMVDDSLRRHPSELVASVFMDDEEPRVIVVMAPSWEKWKEDPGSRRFLAFDAHTGSLLQESPTLSRNAVTGFLLKLHRDLFAGLAGELFLGSMGLLFIAAIVSGVVLYGPYMKKLEFGAVRTGRSKRLRWLDLHNLFGIVTVTWALVVGATGVMNEISTPLFALWQKTDVQAMLRPWHGQQPPPPSEIVSVAQAFKLAQQTLPDMEIFSAVFPGSPIGSPFHYQIWTRGKTALTARLFSPLLIDARSGELTAVLAMPWYLRALEISRPLHFGDYGAMPLKIIWGVLDLITIAVLVSGLYLWLARRKAVAKRQFILPANDPE